MASFLSLDVGPSTVTVAIGKPHGDIVQLTDMVKIDLPAGCIVDGMIADKGLFRSALASGISGYALRAKNTIVSIHSGSIVTRKLEVPASSPLELESLVEYEMRQHLPSGKDYVVDYVQIDKHVNEQGSKVALVKAMALPQSACDAYYEVLVEQGLRPIALDTHHQVLTKLFCAGNVVNEVTLKRKPIALMELSSFQTVIHLILNDEVDLSRSIPVGMMNLERTLADRMKISPDEAAIKLKSMKDPNNEDAELLDAVKRFFNQLAQEMRKVAQYVKTKGIAEPLETIWVYGVGAERQWVEKVLAEGQETPVSLVKKHNRIQQTEKCANLPMASWLVTAGAILRAKGG